MAAASILAVTIGGAVAIAQDGGDVGAEASGGTQGEALLLGRTNGTSANPITGQTILFANNNQYALRESNLSDAGGGAIHGCRTQPPPADAAAPGDKPCLRANNLSTGQAFQFQTTQGTVGGRIQVGGTDINQVNATAVPFETNAGGMVKNLFSEKANTANSATNATNATNAETANTVSNGAITAPKLGPIVKRVASVVVAANSTGTVNVSCQPGEIRLAGGGGFLGGEMDAEISFSGQVGPETGNWRIHAQNNVNANRILEAQVHCLQP